MNNHDQRGYMVVFGTTLSYTMSKCSFCNNNCYKVNVRNQTVIINK
jgi:hypothetical protein